MTDKEIILEIDQQAHVEHEERDAILDQIMLGANEQEKELIAQWSKNNSFVIDLSKEYKEPEYTVYMNGVGCFPKGDIQAIKAKSKQGKTFACSVIISSLFGNSEFGINTNCDTSEKVIFFDTEQNERNSALVDKRIHYLCGWSTKINNERLIVCSLRTMEREKRRLYIEYMIEKNRPSMVVIDGIADLVADFNDIVESEDCIEFLMKTSAKYNCSIVNVLHTNKAKDDRNMKGHLGTLLVQKASDVFEVEKKKEDTISVTQTETRNAPVEGFSFTIDEDGNAHPGSNAIEDKNTEKVNDLLDDLVGIFSDDERSLTYKEFWKRCAEQLGKVKESSFNNFRGRLVKFGLVSKTLDGLWTLNPQIHLPSVPL